MYSKDEMILWSIIYSMVNKIGRLEVLTFSSNCLFEIFKKSVELDINIFKSDDSRVGEIFKSLKDSKEKEKIKLFFKDFKMITNLKTQLLKEMELLKKDGIKITTYLCKDYPKKLKMAKLPPYVIYYLGVLPKENELKASISVVGTRYPEDATIKVFMEDICKSLVGSRYNISGLALGCDTIGHRITLKNRFKNIAVLGQGVSTSVYPLENICLAKEILNNGGAIVSEIPPSLTVKGVYLLRRNRIQAYLSDSLIVLESKEKGGTITTIKYALQEKRDIFIKRTESMVKIFKKIKNRAGVRFIDTGNEIEKEKKIRKENRIKKYERLTLF